MMYRNHLLALAFTAGVLLPSSALAANRRQTIDEMTAESDKVVIGTVGVKSSHWGDDSRIYTDVVVSPDVTIKGAEEGPLTVQVLGGIVGDTRMTVSDGPEFQEGEQVVLFLKRDRGTFQVVGRDTGKYDVSSPEAATVVERALRNVENASGQTMNYKRGIAESYLNRRLTGTTDPLTGTTTTTTSSTGCYSTNGAKWAVSSVTYKIGTSVPSTWVPSINAATATWNSAGAALRLSNDSSSVNELSMVDLVAKYGSSYSNTYAVTTTWSTVSTNQITKAVIEIGTKWQWSTSGQTNMADVQNILTHEFGHWLRLLDIYSPSTCSEVTMWGTAMLGETKKRTLDQADIDGFISLYGKAPSIAAPVLTSPANNSAGVSTSSKLAWNAALGATSYDVYFGTSASPALVATITGTSYSPGTLAGGVTYYWRVVAKNTSGSATSAIWSFTTAGGTLAAPVLVSPANGATGVSVTPVLKWNAVTGATSYDLYVGTTSTPGYIGSVTSTSVTVSGFSSATTYYWKVVARGSSGSSTSAVWWFRTN